MPGEPVLKSQVLHFLLPTFHSTFSNSTLLSLTTESPLLEFLSSVDRTGVEGPAFCLLTSGAIYGLAREVGERTIGNLPVSLLILLLPTGPVCSSIEQPRFYFHSTHIWVSRVPSFTDSVYMQTFWALCSPSILSRKMSPFSGLQSKDQDTYKSNSKTVQASVQENFYAFTAYGYLKDNMQWHVIKELWGYFCRLFPKYDWMVFQKHLSLWDMEGSSSPIGLARGTSVIQDLNDNYQFLCMET